MTSVCHDLSGVLSDTALSVIQFMQNEILHRVCEISELHESVASPPTAACGV